MNRERFHNALALSLGYERIVKDKRITIEVDEADGPWVTLKIQGHPYVVRFKASSDANDVELNSIPAMQEDIKNVAEAVHQAYIQATTYPFSNVARHYLNMRQALIRFSHENKGSIT